MSNAPSAPKRSREQGLELGAEDPVLAELLSPKDGQHSRTRDSGIPKQQDGVVEEAGNIQQGVAGALSKLNGIKVRWRHRAILCASAPRNAPHRRRNDRTPTPPRPHCQLHWSGRKEVGYPRMFLRRTLGRVIQT